MAFGTTFFKFIGVPSVVAGIAALFGIYAEMFTVTQLTEVFSKFWPFILTGLVFIVGMETTNRVSREIKTEAAQTFYDDNPDARIDKAHREFYHLYRKGKQLAKGTTQQRQEWDLKVRQALRDHCNRASLDIYLLNTGRTDSTKGVSPLPDDCYDAALDRIHRFLAGDFENNIR